MFGIYFINLGWYDVLNDYDTLEAALAAGISKGYEFRVDDMYTGNPVAYWNAFSGTRMA